MATRFPLILVEGITQEIPATDVFRVANLPIMVGDSGSGGVAGVAPAPGTGDAGKLLTGAGAWTGLGAVIDSATAKATPVDADELVVADSGASFVLKKLTWANLKTVLASTFGSFAAVGAWTKSQSCTPVSLTSTSASIAVDASLGNVFTHTMTENTTLANPSNLVAGASITITFRQHASSPKTLAFGSYWYFPGGTDPTITATNSAKDVMCGTVVSTTEVDCVWTGAFA